MRAYQNHFLTGTNTQVKKRTSTAQAFFYATTLVWEQPSTISPNGQKAKVSSKIVIFSVNEIHARALEEVANNAEVFLRWARSWRNETMSDAIGHLILEVQNVHHLPVHVLLGDIAVLVGQERVK